MRDKNARLTLLTSPEHRHVAVKLDARIQVIGDCWVYTGARNQDGYGIVWVDGAAHRAHRVAFELTVGPIPPGWEVDHVWLRGCRHRACIRPAHLEAVTGRVNRQRQADKRRILRLVSRAAA